MKRKPSFKITRTGSVETGTGWEWKSPCNQWVVTTPYTRTAVLTHNQTQAKHTFDYPCQAFQWYFENLVDRVRVQP